MISIDKTLISEDLDQLFACDLAYCKGACCVEGDAGAPLEIEEITLIEDALDDVRPFLRQESLEEINTHGVFDLDAEGNFVTLLLKGRECVFTVFEEGIARCAIEKAWLAGKTEFRKPVSCHLYPVRITEYPSYDAVNYHRWHVCRPALEEGRRQQMPLYRYLKEALVRKYGEDWYNQFLAKITEPRKKR